MSRPIPVSIEVLKQDTANALSSLLSLRRGNKKKAEFVVVASAAISAATTIAIGLTSLVANWSTAFQVTALILSASLTVLTAWDGLYNHKRLWLIQAGIVNSLRQVETDLRHLEAADEIDQDAVNELYARYRAAYEEYNAQWQEMRMDDEHAVPTKLKDDSGITNR